MKYLFPIEYEDYFAYIEDYDLNSAISQFKTIFNLPKDVSPKLAFGTVYPFNYKEA